jgi:hypothetical protein
MGSRLQRPGARGGWSRVRVQSSPAADRALLAVDVEQIERLRLRARSMGLRQTAAGAAWLLREVGKARRRAAGAK